MTQRRKILIVVLLAAALTWPFIGGQYGTSLMTQIFIFGMLALSADLLLGHAGLFSLCHAAFFSVAAYTTAILQVRYQVPTALAAPAGILMGTSLGLLFGLSVRTRGVYFILVTLAMGYVIWGIGYRWASFTGGDSGVTNVPAPSIGGFTLSTMLEYYYFVLAVLLLVMFLYHRLIRSPFGLALRGIKSGEARMRSLGFSPPRHLYTAFIVSSFMASLAGVLYAYFNKFVNPVSASLHVSFEAVLMALVGGTATILGPFIGAGIILGLRNWVSSFFELHLAVMGLVFIIVVTWAPDGVIGLLKRFIDRRKAGADHG
jgi:branched-chain amino acid transport system permease protein